MASLLTFWMTFFWMHLGFYIIQKCKVLELERDIWSLSLFINIWGYNIMTELLNNEHLMLLRVREKYQLTITIERWTPG